MNSGASISWFSELEKITVSPWAVGHSLAQWEEMIDLMDLEGFVFPVPPHWSLPPHSRLLNPHPIWFWFISWLLFFYSVLPDSFPHYKSTPNLLVNKQISNKYTEINKYIEIKIINESDLHFLFNICMYYRKVPREYTKE